MGRTGWSNHESERLPFVQLDDGSDEEAASSPRAAFSSPSAASDGDTSDAPPKDFFHRSESHWGMEKTRLLVWLTLSVFVMFTIAIICVVTLKNGDALAGAGDEQLNPSQFAEQHAKRLPCLTRTCTIAAGDFLNTLEGERKALLAQEAADSQRKTNAGFQAVVNDTSNTKIPTPDSGQTFNRGQVLSAVCTRPYQFSCEGWVEHSERPSELPLFIKSFEEVQSRTRVELKRIIDNQPTCGAPEADDPSSVAGYDAMLNCFWERCLDSDNEREVVRATPFIDHLTHSEELHCFTADLFSHDESHSPQKEDQTPTIAPCEVSSELLGALQLIGVETFPAVSVSLNTIHPEQLQTFSLSQGGLGLHYAQYSQPDLVEAYTTHVAELFALFRDNLRDYSALNRPPGERHPGVRSLDPLPEEFSSTSQPASPTATTSSTVASPSPPASTKPTLPLVRKLAESVVQFEKSLRDISRPKVDRLDPSKNTFALTVAQADTLLAGIENSTPTTSAEARTGSASPGFTVEALLSKMLSYLLPSERNVPTSSSSLDTTAKYIRA